MKRSKRGLLLENVPKINRFSRLIFLNTEILTPET